MKKAGDRRFSRCENDKKSPSNLTLGSSSTQSGSEISEPNKQSLANVRVSKRAALLGVFLFKELGYISGFVVVTVIILALCLVQ